MMSINGGLQLLLQNKQSLLAIQSGELSVFHRITVSQSVTNSPESSPSLIALL